VGLALAVELPEALPDTEPLPVLEAEKVTLDTWKLGGMEAKARREEVAEAMAVAVTEKLPKGLTQ
jgi:hypothetical protein